MKKVALTFGLVSGLVTIVTMAIGIRLMESLAYRQMELLGYTGLVVSALLVFFGIRSFREGREERRMTFGRGLAVGVMISLVASACYIAAFELANFVLMPGLAQKYATCMVDQAKAKGAGEEKLRETEAQAAMLLKLWSQPLGLAAVSFAESFPIGLVASLLSAGILRRK